MCSSNILRRTVIFRAVARYRGVPTLPFCVRPAAAFFSRALALSVVLLGPALTGAAADPAARRLPLAAITRAPADGGGSFAALRRGFTMSEVLFAVGAPDRRLPPATWVYADCTTTDPEARRAGYDTVLLRFEDGRLAELRLVSGADLRALLERVRIAHSLLARR